MSDFFIRHCAPVFLGVKPAALVRLCAAEMALVCQYTQLCPVKAVRVCEITADLAADRRYLCFLYIPQLIDQVFMGCGVLYVLKTLGYKGARVSQYVYELLLRLRSYYRGGCMFPHEIGLFLGYPLEDVLGFFIHGGRNAKYMGEWKVYGDVAAAKALEYFHRGAVKTLALALRSGMDMETVLELYWRP